MRKINKIILHCSATKEEQVYTVEDIRRWHIARGFSDVGYHYIIYLDGSVHNGRPIERVGAHCTGQNKDSIGICYVGGLASNNKPKDTRTESQKEALVKLVKKLMAEYGLQSSDVYCHNEFAAKACPCFSIDEFRAELYQNNQND